MPTNDDGPDKPTEETSDELPTGPVIYVNVSRENVQTALRVADEYGIALEDALVRLTAFDFPLDALDDAADDAECHCGS